MKSSNFIDAAMEVLLLLNHAEIEVGVDEQERIILEVASGKLSREELTAWLKAHVAIRT